MIVTTLASGCAGAGMALGGLAMEAGRRFLSTTAEKNFEPEYQESFTKLLDLLMVSTMSREVAASSVLSNTPPLVTTASAGVDEPPPPEEDLTAVSVEEADVAVPRQVESSQAVALELDVSVLREVVVDGVSRIVPLADDDVIRDGVGRADDGDNLKIQFRASTACYVYAVWIDATAWTTPIFPTSEAGTFENPVRANETYSIPGGNSWWHLDDRRGVENLYFVASREPLADLETTLASFVGRERERAFREDVVEVALNDEPAAIGRGLAGVRPGRATLVQASDGSTREVQSTSFFANFAASDMVVHRWFRHQ